MLGVRLCSGRAFSGRSDKSLFSKACCRCTSSLRTPRHWTSLTSPSGKPLRTCHSWTQLAVPCECLVSLPWLRLLHQIVEDALDQPDQPFRRAVAGIVSRPACLLSTTASCSLAAMFCAVHTKATCCCLQSSVRCTRTLQPRLQTEPACAVQATGSSVQPVSARARRARHLLAGEWRVLHPQFWA